MIIFGKTFKTDISDTAEILVCCDFPVITAEDIASFRAFAKKKSTVVMTGCLTDIHPYRVMYIYENGCAGPLADISQKIRGSRHYYPEIYSFIPALIFVPPNVNIAEFLEKNTPEMYVMANEKLLDKKRFPDRLFLKRVSYL